MPEAAARLEKISEKVSKIEQIAPALGVTLVLLSRWECAVKQAP
jgi:hypothetical protein